MNLHSKHSPVLIVAGSGISAVSHITKETEAAVIQADIVLYSVADPVTEQWLHGHNNNCYSLDDSYQDDRRLNETYQEMINRVIHYLRIGKTVCALFYGHPGMFVYAGHGAVARARQEGFIARMLPAISSIDCMIADLGLDPSMGFQIYESTDFLIHARTPDPSVALVLLQAAHLGELTPGHAGIGDRNLSVLRDYLVRFYGKDAEVIIYQSSHFSIARHKEERVLLTRLAEASVSRISTIVIPPTCEPMVHPVYLEKLGLQI